MKLRLVSWTILTILIAAVAAVALYITPEVGFGYDTNPWSISGDEPDFPLELEGDFFKYIGLDADMRLFRKGGWSLKGAMAFEYKGYVQNVQKNYLSIIPKVTAIRKGYWASLSYGYIPRYSIRPVKDAEDSYTYKFPEYAANEFLLRTAWSPMKDLWLEGRAEYQLNYYDASFLEYDQNQWSFGGYLRYSGDVYAKAGYRYTDSRSQGFDIQGETRENSDDTDGSYEEDRFYLRTGKDFGRFSAYISGTYYLRYYTSEKGLDDPIHYTRKDTYMSAHLDLGYDFGQVELSLKTGYADRNADSKINPDLPILRDYDAFDVGIYIEYNGIEIE